MVRYCGCTANREFMSRFFAKPSDIEGKYIYLRDKSDLHHMKKVLRLSIGDEIDVSDGEVWEYRTRLEEMDNEEAVLLILDKQKFAREPKLEITLYQGIPKASKMESIIQKSVELGVYAIVPVFMERTVIVDKGNFSKKLHRWQKISDEAVKQCKRGVIPEVREPLAFLQMVKELPEYDLVLFPYENEDNVTIKDCLRALREEEKPKSVAIIIGPEGGFSKGEAESLDEANTKRVSLGKTILRTETAGPTAIAMTMYELEL